MKHLVLSLLLLVIPAAALADRPAFTPVRWNEDYTFLRDPEQRTEFLDEIKYIPLNDEGDWYLSLGGMARYRYEYFNNPAWGAMPDDGYHLFRFMAHADLHLGPRVRTFVQAQSAFVEQRTGGPRPGLDQDRFNIHQAFLDLRLLEEQPSLTLRVGRQNLLYGAQRLISPLEWANVRRTFDGVKIISGWENATFDVFWVRPVLIQDRRAFNRPNNQVDFAGGYYSRAMPRLFEGAGTRMDVYLLYLDRNTGVFQAGAEAERRYTLGSRLAGRPRPWDFDVEGAVQFGSFGDQNIRAWMFAAEAGYTFADATFSPRPFIGFDIASGDRRPGDGRMQTFNQLFPLGHAFLGYIDVIGRQNIVDLHPGVVLRLTPDVTLRGDYHLFWRHSRNDALYNAGGGIIRPGVASDARFVGSEIDLFLTWQMNRQWQSYFGYSHFFPGRFIRQTGPARDIDFVYAALQFTF
jgi:hypothetical protein